MKTPNRQWMQRASGEQLLVLGRAPDRQEGARNAKEASGIIELWCWLPANRRTPT